MPSRRVVSLAPLLLSLAAGCVLTEIPSETSDTALRREQRAQADRVARALCAGYYDCGCEDPYPPHESEADCLDTVSDELVARLEQGLNRKLDYDPECLDAQADLLEHVGCTPTNLILRDTELWTLLDAAERCQTYHGGVNSGEECEALITARGGDCEPGLVCNDFSTCASVEVAGEGQPCTDDVVGCAAGLWCIEEWLTGAGTCMRLPAVGESCEPTLGQCDFDGWCDFTDYTCRPWAPPGQSCEISQGGVDTCGYQAHCEAATCIAAPTEGAPCGQGCALGFTCGDDDLCIRARAHVCDAQETLP